LNMLCLSHYFSYKTHSNNLLFSVKIRQLKKVIQSNKLTV
jgi:hypothetical protein